MTVNNDLCKKTCVKVHIWEIGNRPCQKSHPSRLAGQYLKFKTGNLHSRTNNPSEFGLTWWTVYFLDEPFFLIQNLKIKYLKLNFIFTDFWFSKIMRLIKLSFQTKIFWGWVRGFLWNFQLWRASQTPIIKLSGFLYSKMSSSQNYWN